jgi:uncharacterized protein (DUF1499 family)
LISLAKIKAYLTVNDVTAGRSKYYLNLSSLTLQQPRDRILKTVRKAFRAGGAGWTIEKYSPEEARLEGTVTTPVFGFIDDFEVWLEPVNQDPETWRIVARSQSRVGRGDLGKNARNIRSFYQRLREIQSED